MMQIPMGHILPGLYEKTDGRTLERDPPRVCPFVMTSEEVVRFCRLDGLRDPDDVLYQHRRAGRLHGFQLGRNIRYLLPDAIRFLEKLVEEKPR